MAKQGVLSSFTSMRRRRTFFVRGRGGRRRLGVGTPCWHYNCQGSSCGSSSEKGCWVDPCKEGVPIVKQDLSGRPAM